MCVWCGVCVEWCVSGVCVGCGVCLFVRGACGVCVCVGGVWCVVCVSVVYEPVVCVCSVCVMWVYVCVFVWGVDVCGVFVCVGVCVCFLCVWWCERVSAENIRTFFSPSLLGKSFIRLCGIM